jgi:hypothetical protein
MTDLSRRSFLGGILAVGAATTVVAAIPLDLTPRIWADGIHDDYAGLQAALNGKPFVCEDSVIADTDSVIIRYGTFRISAALKLRDARINIGHCHFFGDKGVTTMVDGRGGKDCSIIHNSIFETHPETVWGIDDYIMIFDDHSSVRRPFNVFLGVR